MMMMMMAWRLLQQLLQCDDYYFDNDNNDADDDTEMMMMHDSNDVSMSIHVWHHIEIHKHLVAHDEGLVEEEEQQLVEVISPRILVDQVPRELSHSAVEQGR